jgi:hypothetical protein
MKNISLILTLILISSCTPAWVKEEAKKSAQTSASSSRINSGASNNSDLFKELDE